MFELFPESDSGDQPDDLSFGVPHILSLIWLEFPSGSSRFRTMGRLKAEPTQLTFGLQFLFFRFRLTSFLAGLGLTFDPRSHSPIRVAPCACRTLQHSDRSKSQARVFQAGRAFLYVTKRGALPTPVPMCSGLIHILQLYERSLNASTQQPAITSPYIATYISFVAMTQA